MSSSPLNIELLAPARDLETGRVAVSAGADAVYIGGPDFGARKAAGNSVEGIAELVRYAHPFGVRVYVTLNTLLWDSELADAEKVARRLTAAGVDALIVQDMAWLRMGLEVVEMHASTQTSNIRPDEIAFLGRAGFRRVILERSLSLEEIRAIRAAVPEDVELETFIHGAICVGYSGRCFMSRAMNGSRSGNRGDCAQPCRLAYDLTDGNGEMPIKGKHLLSVRDLDLSAHIGELMDVGVTSFKIEGRLKDVAYVRNIVSYYRGVIDRELAARPGLRRVSAGHSRPDFVPDPSKSFTRGATDYFFGGAVAEVASFNTPKSVGERLGSVGRVDYERTGNGFFTLAAGEDTDTAVGIGLGAAAGAEKLAAGDGICFFSGGELRGTNINRVEAGRAYPNRMDGIVPGVEIFRNYDHVFTRTVEHSRAVRKIDASVSLTRGRGRLSVNFTDETGLSVEVGLDGEFEMAAKPEKMVDVARKELSQSGDTVFDIRSENIEFVGEELFVPASALARLRREGLARLTGARQRLVPERNPAKEDVAVKFPREVLTGAENVTNRLAERFWRDHGVSDIEPSIELGGLAEGDVVMRSRYCIRREIGWCLRDGARLRGVGLREETDLREKMGVNMSRSGEKAEPGGTLFLERGRTRWKLEFDCAACEMVVKACTGAIAGMDTVKARAATASASTVPANKTIR